TCCASTATSRPRPARARRPRRAEPGAAMDGNDTIAAIATAAGAAGVGIVRLSGPGSGHIARALCGRLPPERQAARVHFREADGSVIDDGLLLLFRSARRPRRAEPGAAMDGNDTIAAIATAAGAAGVGIVRLSGPGSGHIARALCGRLPPERQAARVHFREADGSVIDDGLLLRF